MKHIAAVLALIFAALSSIPSWPEDWARSEARELVKQVMPFERGKCLSLGAFDND